MVQRCWARRPNDGTHSLPYTAQTYKRCGSMHNQLERAGPILTASVNELTLAPKVRLAVRIGPVFIATGRVSPAEARMRNRLQAR
jgi:hypothetical protein